MPSFFGRIRTALGKTAQGIRDRLADAPDPEAPAAPAARAGRPGQALQVESLEAVEDALLSADVGLSATTVILGAMEREAGPVRDRVGAVILRMLREVDVPAPVTALPHVCLVVGVNGTGKTTTVGKLAAFHRQQGRSVVIGAADTFRAAAVEQLAIWADRAGVELVRARPGTDPAAVAFDAVAAARARGRDVVIVDTAGRLHTRANLMSELGKIRRVVGKDVESAPHEVLLVLDATVGQNGLVQAREFMAAGGANGIVLTKLDGTAKGGVAVAIAHELKLPIRYLGVGEGLDDLVPFDAEEYVDALFVRK